MVAFNQRGQGTTEYLIILAVVIIVALVVVGVLGGFPALGTGISEGQAKAYWKTTSPLNIDDWSISSTSHSLVLQNITTSRIQVTDITLNGVASTVADANIAASSKGTFTAANITCTSGSNYSYDVVITYDTANLTGKKLVGASPIVGRCP